MFMRELQEVNEKFQSSERMRSEMEVNYGKRSNLGELQDDIDVEKELLRQQREEVAVLKEQLQSKVDSFHMSPKLSPLKTKTWQLLGCGSILGCQNFHW